MIDSRNYVSQEGRRVFLATLALHGISLPAFCMQSGLAYQWTWSRITGRTRMQHGDYDILNTALVSATGSEWKSIAFEPRGLS